MTSTLAWSFYLGFYVRIAYASKSLLLDSQIELASTGGLFVFILVFGGISFLISYRMLKHRDITKKQPGIILSSGIAASITFNILSS